MSVEFGSWCGVSADSCSPHTLYCIVYRSLIDMAALDIATAQRGQMRAALTRIYNDRDNFDSYSLVKRNQTIQKLSRLPADIAILDEKILHLKFPEIVDQAVLQADLELIEQYKDKLLECQSMFTQPIPVSQIQTGSVTGGGITSIPKSLLKCPTAPLPKFTSASGENLEIFLNNFEETLSKFNYTQYDRLLLLKQQVSGKASLLIDSLEPEKQTYDEAKNLLMTALASKDIQKYNVIKKMGELRMTYSSEPFQYISDIRKIMQSVKSLDVTIEDVMQFYFFNGLNESFKNHLTLITNNLRPTLTEINDNFFTANERYEASKKSFKNNKFSKDETESTVLSTKTSCTVTNSTAVNPFHRCPLCERNEHPVNKCSAYVKPMDKISRIKVLRGCVKCCSLEHSADRCNFRFKKSCTVCSKWHFTFMCPDKNDRNPATGANSVECSKTQGARNKTPKPISSSKGSTVGGTSCGIVCASFFQENLEVDSALATFTANTKDDVLVRGLFDNGSQSSFITEPNLSKFEHIILNNDVKLTIRGINNAKSFDSKLVNAKLRLGGKTRSIDLLVVPSIDISLHLPRLNEVVTEFQDRNYLLADGLLNNQSEYLNEFGIILGANAAHLFQGETVKYGNSSVYLDTDFGILLLGSIKIMLADLRNLKRSPINLHNKSVTTQSYAIGLGFALDSPSPPLAKSSDDSSAQYEFAVKDLESESFDKCSDSVLDNTCSYYLHKQVDNIDDNDSERSSILIKYLLDNCTRFPDGRLCLPILWNGKVKHLLAKNYNLATKILESNFKKFGQSPEKLGMIDDNIRELVATGIVEKVDNVEQLMAENPTCSFLPHNSIFKLNNDTTKVRTVFLSNLAEKFGKANCISHNQAMHAGPNMNQKLTTALILLRFDPYLLCFDLKRAFLQVALPECDQEKLLFFWYKNVKKGDFTIQTYKNMRLPFGLRPSPTILMVALYKMLILDAKDDDEKLRGLKQLVYSLTYMDNCAVSAQSTEELSWAYSLLNGIFNPYKFELQKFFTNDENLQTVVEDGVKEEVQLFGICWNTKNDTLASNQKYLDPAADTKRKVLKTIAKNFDPYQFDGPIMNRARLFMHDLQCEKNLKWDQVLSTEKIREWKNISNQVNGSEPICIKRCVGSRSSNYELVAFTDSSVTIYGCVIYIKNIETNEVQFLLAKNRIVGKLLEAKSVPSLELAGIVLGAETLADVKNELSGENCLNPITISGMILYSDSLVALNWLNARVNKLDKENKLSVFVKNRLDKIEKICENNPVTFTFVQGSCNPADMTTRSVSHKLLLKSNFISGPKFLTEYVNEISFADTLTILIPNPKHVFLQAEKTTTEEVPTVSMVQTTRPESGIAPLGPEVGEAPLGPSGVGEPSGAARALAPLVPPERFSKFSKLVSTYEYIFKFINVLKRKLITRNPDKYKHLHCKDATIEAINYIVKCDQQSNFSSILEYFSKSNSPNSEIPNLVTQLNIFMDGNGLLRVGSKMSKHLYNQEAFCPILLSKSSLLTTLIVRKYHEKLSHAGIYNVLTQLRKKFYIPCCFSVVKKILKNCIHCKRYNARTIKLNQSSYRDFRLMPKETPFATIALDYAGPYRVRVNNEITKVYILVITCLFTRAINLKLSIDLSVPEFLRSLQMHVHEFGLSQFVLSDMGTSLIAGANIITNFLSDADTINYLKNSNSSLINFQQYYKGHHELGSLVETCVKMTKRLISGSLKNNIISLREFEFIVSQTVHLVNRRPIAFKESLRDSENFELPVVITPELLIHGFNLPSVNIIPALQAVDMNEFSVDEDFDPIQNVRNTDDKLRKIRQYLNDVYNDEFLPQLISQATNEKSRYAPVRHDPLSVGDLVLIKEDNTKQTNYPMGKIKSVTVNDLGEVTGAIVCKGSTGESVKRHSSALIPLLHECAEEVEVGSSTAESAAEVDMPTRPRRAAALDSERRSREMLAIR